MGSLLPVCGPRGQLELQPGLKRQQGSSPGIVVRLPPEAIHRDGLHSACRAATLYAERQMLESPLISSVQYSLRGEGLYENAGGWEM